MKSKPPPAMPTLALTGVRPQRRPPPTHATQEDPDDGNLTTFTALRSEPPSNPNSEPITKRYSIPPQHLDLTSGYRQVLRGKHSKHPVSDSGEREIIAERALQLIENHVPLARAREQLKRLRNGSGTIDSVIIIDYVLQHLHLRYEDISISLTESEYHDLRKRTYVREAKRLTSTWVAMPNLGCGYFIRSVSEAYPDEAQNICPNPNNLGKGERTAHIHFARELVAMLQLDQGSPGIVAMLRFAIDEWHIDVVKDLKLPSQDAYRTLCDAYRVAV